MKRSEQFSELNELNGRVQLLRACPTRSPAVPAFRDLRTTSVDNSGTPNVVLTSGYDLAGDRTSVAARIGKTADFLNSYSFDADQRMTMVQQQQQAGGNGVAPKEIDLGYNALGQFSSMVDYAYIGNGPRTDIATGAYSYDTGNRMTALNYTANGGQTHIDAYTWGFDDANRVTSTTTTADGSATYGYDNVNELTSATYTGSNQPANEAYSFDANGNRNMSGWTTGSANVMTSDGTFNYQTDADGNRTVRTRISNAQANDYQTKYFYDYRNRLTDEEYFNNSGTLTKHVHFVYDVLDREIGEQIDDTGGGTYNRSQWFVFDGTQPVEQFDGSGNQTVRNLVAPNPAGVDAVMATEAIGTPGQSGTTAWSLPDDLGTTRDTVNNNSAVVDHVVTNSFGQISSQSNLSAQPYNGFGGGHIDGDTGDVTNLERRYDPTTGGWTTKDPLDFSAGDPNTGRYSGNSPMNAIDPTGLDGRGGPIGPFTNPNSQIPWSEFPKYTQLTPYQLFCAGNLGCFGLMYANLGVIPQTGSQGKNPAFPLNPMVLPGMTMFGSYGAAQQYCAQNPGSTMIAYQFQYGAATSTIPWQPPTAGKLTPNQIPLPYNGEGTYNNGNWCTAMYSDWYEKWFWQYMNFGSATASLTQKPQLVINTPINPNSVTGGMPAGVGYNTTIFGVYLPPPSPPPSWRAAMWAASLVNNIGYLWYLQGPITPPGL